jgi:glutathione S-transferase
MYSLFYYPRNASWAIHILLRELQVEHQLVLVDRKQNAQKSLEYLKLNPTGRIPTLVIEACKSSAVAILFNHDFCARNDVVLLPR